MKCSLFNEGSFSKKIHKKTCIIVEKRCTFAASKLKRGNSSVGRARPCQGRGREFESRFPLQKNYPDAIGIFFKRKLPEWWNGRHEGLKILWPLRPCRFESGLGYQKGN
jgi:hypothetical protein